MAEVVVGVDGSQNAAVAPRWAVREAELRHARVVAVLAWGFLDQYPVAPNEPCKPTYAEAEARRALDAYVCAALSPEEAPAVERRVVCDMAARGLLGAAAEAILLVVGARGVGGFKGMQLGSVSQHCLHHAPCPVAVVRDASLREDKIRRIVVGVDGSEPSLAALDWALTEAHLRPARVDVVHSWCVPCLADDPYALASRERYEEAGRRILEDALKAQKVSGLEVPVKRVLTSGSAAWSILDAAKHADLIVVGSRGRGGFAGLLLGSVSHQVATHAECPVVVLPAAKGSLCLPHRSEALQ